MFVRTQAPDVDDAQTANLTVLELKDRISGMEIKQNALRVDRFFAGILILEWILSPALAFFSGSSAWLTFLSMGAVTSLPLLAVSFRSGSGPCRYSIAVVQILYCHLFLHFLGDGVAKSFLVVGPKLVHQQKDYKFRLGLLRPGRKA